MPVCGETMSGVSLARTPRGQLIGPLSQPVEVLGVVPGGALPDPPRRLVARLPQRVPGLEHPAAGGLCLDPGHLPRLASHARKERRVQYVDAYVVALVRAGADPLELDLRLGQPCSQVGDHVAERPVRVAVVAGHETSSGVSDRTRRTSSCQPCRSASISTRYG